MSVASEITRINNNITNAYTQVSAKGGTLPATQNSANLATAIASISGGSSGLEYESGTLSIEDGDINVLNITFNDTHNTTPTIIIVKDNTTSSTIGNLGIMNWLYFDYEKLGNKLVMPTSSGGTSNRFADIIVYARTDSTASYGNTTNVCSYSSSTTISTYTRYYPRYFVSETGFNIKLDWISSTSSIKDAVFKNGREYKWIAIWK